MASFQVHDDQENQLSNIGKLKNNQTSKNARIGHQQKRTVLGDINSNSSRIVTRASLKVSITIIVNDILILIISGFDKTW